METKLRMEYFRKVSELGALQALKHSGGANVMRSARECRRLYGGAWMDAQIKAGLLQGVKMGRRTMYSVEDILSLQAAQLQEAAETINETIETNQIQAKI